MSLASADPKPDLIGASEPHPPREVGDAALVLRMTQGDRAALAELYQRHGRTLLAVACAVLHSRQEAEDVIHDVFLEAWRHADTYSESRGSVKTWLLIRARTRALDRLRSSGRRRDVLDHVARNQPAESAVMVESGDQHRLHQALAAMPAPQQQVIQLSYFEGLTTAEIAHRLGIPTGTVKSRTRAALESLRSVLGLNDG